MYIIIQNLFAYLERGVQKIKYCQLLSIVPRVCSTRRPTHVCRPPLPPRRRRWNRSGSPLPPSRGRRHSAGWAQPPAECWCPRGHRAGSPAADRSRSLSVTRTGTGGCRYAEGCAITGPKLSTTLNRNLIGRYTEFRNSQLISFDNLAQAWFIIFSTQQPLWLIRYT